MSKAICCATCRWWDAHSLELKLGDCRHETDGVPHRYSRVLMPNGTHAMLDSFGREETKPTFVCGAWSKGDTEYA